VPPIIEVGPHIPDFSTRSGSCAALQTDFASPLMLRSGGDAAYGRGQSTRGAVMRHLMALFVIASVLAVEPASGQVGFDRPGGDYTSFVVKSRDPALCAGRCERDAHCRAWAFAYPTLGNSNATCWLKNEVRPRVPGSCCVSGVRGAGVVEPRSAAVEFAIDRAGGDFRKLEMTPDPTGAACRAACEADGHCRAWTYARPGYEPPPANCFLKDHITPPRRSPCCISGVVR
jgi:hypothetical protein